MSTGLAWKITLTLVRLQALLTLLMKLTLGQTNFKLTVYVFLKFTLAHFHVQNTAQFAWKITKLGANLKPMAYDEQL